MVRIYLLLMISCFFVGCANSPYHKRTISDSKDNEVEIFFAYGKYCGPGYPILNPISTEKNAILNVFEGYAKAHPPADDLDAICFAHDYCYARQGANDLACDLIFWRIVMKYYRDFQGKGCEDLSWDMVRVFFGKSWSHTKDYRENSNSLERGITTLGYSIVRAPIFAASFVFDLLFWRRPLDNHPKTEGKCNLGIEANHQKLISEFNNELDQMCKESEAQGEPC